MTRADCPDPHTLASLLETEGTREGAEHLDTCDQCRQTLAELAADPSTWESAARHLPQLPNQSSEPALERAMQQLEHDPPLLATPAETVSADELLALLRAPDRPDLLGYLGRYEVQAVLGRGGMGVVFKAFDPALHRMVAIKVLAPQWAGSITARKRFVREGRAAAAITHEHVVAIYEVDETAGLPYLVMQYVAGESLQERLDRTGPLPVEEVVRIGLQTAQGLAAAHAQGLIHRDIKPANLLLENGLARVTITDFGLARTTDDAGLTQDGVVAGTPEYMAPEQARGEAVDHRADLFSLGSVLYAMCTDVSPFHGPSPLVVLRRVCEQAPGALRERNSEVPAWLEAFVARLLAKAPADRVPSAAAVAELLEAYLAHLRQPATVPAPALPAGDRARHSPRRRRLPVLALAALGLLVVGLMLGQQWLAMQAPVQESAKKFKVFHQDFRGHGVDDDYFLYTGPHARQVIQSEAEGLRIALPVEDAKPQATGLVMRFPIKGDCEITTSYELLQAERPPKGPGVGVSLWVVTDTPTQEAATVGRYHRTEGHFYVCGRGTTDAQGKRQYSIRVFPTEARSGRLRLVRRGAVATCLAADEDESDFQELQQLVLGTEDLVTVRVAADPGQSGTPVEVRIKDIEIHTEDLPGAGPLDASENAPPVKPRGWRGAAGLLGLFLTFALLVALAVRLSARRRKREAPVPASPPQPQAAPVLVFRCPGCGKSGKARAAFAGKKVKCPQCGAAVVVPATGDT